jgi:hypothetical protein
MTAVQALLSEAIDYAGLFPPASLDFERTAENYAAYRTGKDAWALGRFVLPAARVAEFADRWPERLRAWPITLLLGADFDAELRLAVDLGLQLEAVECRPPRLDEIGQIRMRLPGARLFVEAPANVSLDELLTAVAAAEACAKLRTGGITPEAIPTPDGVAAFLVGCARRKLRFKATAGLHHAVRGEYRLRYEPHSASAIMHGFVNFFLAAAAAYQGGDGVDVVAILSEQDPKSLSANTRELRWREHNFDAETIQTVRTKFAISFGSCSFEEPLAEMRSMEWM